MTGGGYQSIGSTAKTAVVTESGRIFCVYCHNEWKKGVLTLSKKESDALFLQDSKACHLKKWEILKIRVELRLKGCESKNQRDRSKDNQHKYG